MFRKITAVLALVVLAALSLTGCKSSKRIDEMFGKNLVYEKDGFPDEFGIRIDSDGRFSYFEGWFSSYIGLGFWELNGDTLILREMSNFGDMLSEVKRINRFKVADDGLIFIADGSDNFTYIKVSDGEHFYFADDITNI